MKSSLSTFLMLLCAVLMVAVVLIKKNDSAQHGNDVGAFENVSNQLSSAQDEIIVQGGTILTFSNNLTESQTAATTFSNQLTEAKSEIVSSTQQITNLNQQIIEWESENQSLNEQISVLTNSVAELEKKDALAEASLAEANKDYALLENRLQRDVAERVVVERKFNNLFELQNQTQKLKQSGGTNFISAESIYSGLDLEVKSNGVIHVIAPD